jgi:hypothetical protein
MKDESSRKIEQGMASTSSVHLRKTVSFSDALSPAADLPLRRPQVNKEPIKVPVSAVNRPAVAADNGEKINVRPLTTGSI